MLKLDTVELPYEMNWIDEFSWASVSAAQSRTVGGKQIIEESQTLSVAGRPITLSSDNAWMVYSDALILRAWADELNKTMALTMHNGSIYQVRFRLWEPPAVQWVPLINKANLTSTDQGVLSLKLIVA
jgi:hypothetical protein